MSTEPGAGTDAGATTDVAAEAAGDPTEPAGDPAENRPAGDFERRTTVIARTVVRVVVPIILLTAVSLLFQGHNYPGGGFIGGVLTVTAFALVYIIFGLDYIRDVLFDRPGLDTVGVYRWVFAAGLAIAAGSGLAPILGGYPFLTQGVLFLKHVPLYGEFEVASAFAFDVGVYLTVVGALLTILAEVGGE